MKMMDFLLRALESWPEEYGNRCTLLEQYGTGNSVLTFKAGGIVVTFKLNERAGAIVYRSDWLEMKARLSGEWNGEGLPPVGMHVHIVDPEGVLMYGLGESGEVIAHVEDTAVVRMSYGLGCFTAKHLRTGEQIAAEDRKTACEQMCIDSGGRVCDSQMAIAYMLYDKGYRKQPEAHKEGRS